MRRVKCSGCNCWTWDYTDYESFVVCNECEQEMIEEDERRIEAEEELEVSRYCYKGE